jgi:hypothetical protein
MNVSSFKNSFEAGKISPPFLKMAAKLDEKVIFLNTKFHELLPRGVNSFDF